MRSRCRAGARRFAAACLLLLAILTFPVPASAQTAPGAPTGLAAIANGQDQIDLAWTAPVVTGGSAITGYRIEVSPDGTSSSWTDLVADTASTATTYSHTGLDAATTRHYRVSAINAVGTSDPSDSADATTGAPMQTATTLISNSAQVSTNTSSATRATAFTTGGNSGGYELSSVDLYTGELSDTVTPAVEIYEDNAGTPGALHATLINPATVAQDSVNTFNAQPNTTLNAGTIYWLVSSNSAAANGRGFRVRTLTDATADTGAAMGWSIGNAAWKSVITDSWSTTRNRIKFAVKGTVAGGTVNTPATGAPTITGTARVGRTLTAATTGITDANGLASPGYTYQWIRVDGTEADIAGANSSTYTLDAADLGKTIKVKVSFTDDDGYAETLTSGAYPTSGTVRADNTLVSNVGQSPSGSGILANNDIAQSFTTGAGATLASIELNLNSFTSTDTPTVKLFSGSANGTEVATFTGPAMLDTATAKIYTFTPSSSVTLLGSTTYWVVAEGTANWTLTSSITEDGTSATGWSIANGHEYRTASSTSGFATASASIFQIRVNGTIGGGAATNAAPVFGSSTVALDLAENTVADQDIGAAVTATDADNDTLTYTLGGTDMASFDIVAGTGQIRTITGVSYDHEAKDSYTVTVTASDGTDGADADVTISVTDVDEPPDAPSTISVTAVPDSSTSLTVSWTAPANDGRPAIESYDVQYRVSGATAWTHGPEDVTTTTTIITGLTADTEYEVQVRATNDEGDSDFSDPPGSGQTNLQTNTAPTAANKTVTTAQDTAYTFTATDFGFADTDTGDTLASVRIESLPALGALALNGTVVSLNDVILSADIGSLTFTPAAGESGDDYASFMFKVNDGTDFSADPNTITFNVRDLSCAAPDFSVDNRRQLWTGIVTVEDIRSTAYGFHSGESLGGLDDTTFAIGRNSYTVDIAFVQSTTSSAGRLSFGLAGGVNNNLTAGEVAALRLHVCDTVYDFSAATLSSNTYAWAGSLDWSPPVATRTLYLSLPANNDAIGAPTITGTAQTGQELTADVTGITDADGLTGDLSTLTDDGNLGGVEYSYQWLRVDSDGTSNETEIAGEMASTYTLAAADVGKKVKVKVSFTDDLNGEEDLTSEAYPASATVTATTVPDEPTGLTATAAGAFRIDLAWTAPADTGGSAITGYRIEVSPDGASWSDLVANTGSTATTYAHTGLDAATTRHYRVSAINDVGTSHPSGSDDATTGADTITAQGDVWSGTVTVGEISGFSNGHGYWAAAHPSSYTGGTLSDDNFDIGGTTYTVWRITFDTDSTLFEFTVATGTPPAVTALPNEDELILRLTYGGVAGDFALSDAIYIGSGPQQGYQWNSTVHPSGDPSRGQTMTVALLVNAAPTADNNTVLTPRDTAYTFIASEFGFADTNAGDTLASVRIVSLPAAGTLALAGAAVTTNQVVTKAQIDGNNLTFTPVAGESGDDYASFTFKVNDGIVDSDDAYTMTIDVTVALVAPFPPTGLAATASGQSRIDLAWTAPVNTGGSPITGYRIEVSPDGTSDWTDLVADTASTATTYAHMGLDGATTRHYRVSAINAVGTSDASGSDDATTEAATPAGVILVPLDWSKTPADIGAGERFRLMFGSSTHRDATSTDIAVYNTFVRTVAAAAGLTAVQTYAGDFTALVSTESVNARANTQTRATDTDAPIYWVDRFSIGAHRRVADGYADFYDGTWQSTLVFSEFGTRLSVGTSVLSFIKCRIKAFEIHAGVVRGELPVDLGLDAVSGRLPSRDLVAQDPEGGDAAVEALTDHDAELDLGDVEPTAVLGRVDELEAVPQGLGHGRRKGLVEGAGAVGVQVVHHQCDSLGAGVALGDVVEEVRPVSFGSARRHLGHAPPGQGFRRHEHVTASAASVLVVFARGPTRRRRDRFARLAEQLPGRLVHAHHRKGRIVGTPVDIENPLHRCREVRVALWGNHPADAPPRLDCVFFRTRRTVSCDTLSMWPSSTTRSASNRSDHCEWPCGGSAQLSATRRASNSPSALRT